MLNDSQTNASDGIDFVVYVNFGASKKTEQCQIMQCGCCCCWLDAIQSSGEVNYHFVRLIR